jgi:LemA protein
MLTAPDSGFFTIVVALVPLLLLLLIVLMAVSMYNGLIKSRLRTTEAWSGITVQLKRRASLIPNLVESVRAYTQHEHEVFTEVTEARGALNKAAVPVATATADQGLTQALGHLMVVAENVSEDIKVSFAKD